MINLSMGPLAWGKQATFFLKPIILTQLMWSKCLYPPKLICRKTNHQSDGF